LSESGIHSGHYKAVSFNKYLSALEAAKLTLAAKTGVQLQRWGRGLTILLENIFGNIFNDKMREVCLLEADNHWLNKFVFCKTYED